MHNLPTQINQINGFIKQDGRYWMSVDMLANYLGMSRRGVSAIYERNTEELNWFTSWRNLRQKGKPRKVRMFDEQGCYIIAMRATSEPAKTFRKNLSRFLAELRNQALEMAAMQQEYAALRQQTAQMRLENYLTRGRGLGRHQFKRLVALKQSGLLSNEEIGAVFSISGNRVTFLYKMHREATGDFVNRQPKALRGGK